MSLREDMEALAYYQSRGLAKEFLEGTLTAQQRKDAPQDNAACDESIGKTGREWMAKRGD